MKDAFDRLAKNLVGGMSRREAFKRFASGMALAFGGLFAARLSLADTKGKNVCINWCRGTFSNLPDPPEGKGPCSVLYQAGTPAPGFNDCVTESTKCPPGECAMHCYGTWLCVSVF
jgi:hypothetical protein